MGRHTMDNPQAKARQAPFPLLLSGMCELELDLTGCRFEPMAGDEGLLPWGAAHRLRVEGRRAAANVERGETGLFAFVSNATAEDLERDANVADKHLG
ncbi:hypothetical protein BJY54_006933 [Streptomyces nodosus]|nr:hypothetical protein [Streptomyces nodosus]MBB4796229.1 hypothetical protein [Streptomyces nodosus]